jgi:hypothetical protein
VALRSLSQVIVPAELFDEIEHIYAPPDHPVFQLVPPPLGDWLNILYEELGQPVVTSDTFWDIYLQLLGRFNNSPFAADVEPIIQEHERNTRTIEEEHINILPGLKELRNDFNVVGPYGKYPQDMPAGNRDPLSARQTSNVTSSDVDGVDEREYADFTDSDTDEE